MNLPADRAAPRPRPGRPRLCHGGITFQEAAVEAEQVGLVEVEKDLELVVPCILVDLTMSVEALECAAHEGVAEGEVLVQVLLAAADEFEN